MSETSFSLPHRHLQPAQYDSWVRKANDPDWFGHRYRDSMDRAMVSAIRELMEVRELAAELYTALAQLLGKLPEPTTVDALTSDSGLGHRLYTARYNDKEITELFALAAKANPSTLHTAQPKETK